MKKFRQTKQFRSIISEDMRILQKQLRRASVYRGRTAGAFSRLKHPKRFFEQELAT